MLSEDYIYLNPATLEIALVYIPIQLPGKQINADFYRLVNKLIANIDITGDRANEFVQKTLVEINAEPFNFLNFSQFLADTVLRDKVKPSSAPERKAAYADPAEVIQHQRAIQNPIKAEVKFNQDYAEKDRSLPRQQAVSRDVQNEKNAQGEKGKNTILIVLVQMLLLIGLALIVLETDLTFDEAGNFDPITMAGLILLAGTADFFIVKKLMHGKGLKSDIVNTSIKPPNYNLPKSDPVRHMPVNQPKEKAEMVKKSIPLELVGDHARSIPDKRSVKHHSGEFATELLDSVSDVKKEGYLSYIANGKKESRKIDNNPFIIGKLADQADFIIDSKAVSRVHAEIYLEKGIYYIVDLNSKNGTFLNGERLQSNVRYQLNNNDVLSFAREEFTFIQ